MILCKGIANALNNAAVIMITNRTRKRASQITRQNTEMQSTETMRLLIVDDDMKFCRLISNYLSSFGIDVSSVHNGNDAVDMACGDKWDAIILDVMLPGNDGFAILRKLRERANGTPVLMLTALGEETDRIIGLELGADDYIAKTCSPRELLARLRAVLRRARANTALPIGSSPVHLPSIPPHA